NRAGAGRDQSVGSVGCEFNAAQPGEYAFRHLLIDVPGAVAAAHEGSENTGRNARLRPAESDAEQGVGGTGLDDLPVSTAVAGAENEAAGARNQAVFGGRENALEQVEVGLFKAWNTTAAGFVVGDFLGVLGQSGDFLLFLPGFATVDGVENGAELARDP